MAAVPSNINDRSGLVWDKVIGGLTAGSSEEVLHV